MNIPNTPITRAQLLCQDGAGGSEKWIAYNGIVYDVSECPNWRSDLHRDLHFPAQDLSGEILDAPHAEEVFTRPCIKIVGRFVD